MTDVIDLSHWNVVTDWQKIRGAGVAGVIHKATQGACITDPAFEHRRALAKDAGLLFGRYHFGVAEDVQGQVTNFLRGWTPDELLALDWEDSTPMMSMSEAEEFIDLVQERTGVVPVIYSGHTLKEAVVGRSNTSLTRCRLWLAEWGPAANLPHGWEKYWLWQFTGQASIPGVIGRVDRSRFDGPPIALVAQWAPPNLIGFSA